MDIQQDKGKTLLNYLFDEIGKYTQCWWKLWASTALTCDHHRREGPAGPGRWNMCCPEWEVILEGKGRRRDDQVSKQEVVDNNKGEVVQEGQLGVKKGSPAVYELPPPYIDLLWFFLIEIVQVLFLDQFLFWNNFFCIWYIDKNLGIFLRVELLFQRENWILHEFLSYYFIVKNCKK